MSLLVVRRVRSLPELLETPKSHRPYNVTGNGERDIGRKDYGLGNQQPRPYGSDPAMGKVQRLTLQQGGALLRIAGSSGKYPTASSRERARVKR